MAERRQTTRGTATITYWVWTENTQHNSPFVGFSLAVLRKRPVLEILAALPSNIFELYVERSRAAYARMYGAAGYRVQILAPSHLNSLRLYPRNPFNVFISDAGTCNAVEQYVRSSQLPVLHVSCTHRRGIQNLRSVTRGHIRDLYVRVMSFLQQENEPEMVLLPGSDAPPEHWDAEDIGLQQRNHGVTIPNEMALQSLRFQLARGTPLPPLQAAQGGYATAPANLATLRALQESVVAVRAARSQFNSMHGARPLGNSLAAIVWSPAVDSRLTVPARTHDISLVPLLRTVRALVRQRDYPAITNQSASRLKTIFGSQDAQLLLRHRREELALSTTALGLMAAGHFCPVIRVRPAVNLVRGRLRQLADCAAGRAPRRGRKLSKVARWVGEFLTTEVGPDCMRLLEQDSRRLKLVANAPLELLPIRNLPLQLRSSVSRVPVTPGNVFLSHVIGDPGEFLSPSDLNDILIVRGFEAGDPIRNALVKASRTYLNEAAERLNLRVVDVGSVEEFSEALASFRGNILVFDGHGGHEKDHRGGGFLRLGADRIDPFTLARGVDRIPPIVILSACNTHPLQWSETSSAAGFLMLGARSVLGTVTPVNAKDAAVFVGRLLLRLTDYLPLVAGSGQTWGDLITGLLRMSYVTDLFHAFSANDWIGADCFHEVQYKANVSINSHETDWFEKSLETIARLSQREFSEVEAFWLREAYFSSALQYVHLGSPERIVLVKDDGEDDSEKPASSERLDGTKEQI